MKNTSKKHDITTFGAKHIMRRQTTVMAKPALLAIFILTGSIFLPGCNKYLDQQPDNRTQLNTPAKVSQLLTSAYPNADYVTFCEALSDNSGDRDIADQSGEDPLVNANAYAYKDYPTTNQGSSDNYWFACYAAIAAANQALETCNTAAPADTASYSPYKGEALVARAYAHFMLVTFFAKTYDPATAATDAGIPYVTTATSQLQQKYDRKTVAYDYSMIEQDLKQGIPLINDNAYNVPAYRFTRAAAHAFACRFYMFKQQYAQAITEANLAIPAASMINFLRPVNTTYYAMTSDAFTAAYTSISQPANLLLATTNSGWGGTRANFFARYGLNNTINAALILNGAFSGGTWAISNKDFYYGTDPNNTGIEKYRENFVITNASADIGNPYLYIPIFTAEEVLFNEAEAMIMTNDNTDALNLLNTYLSTRVLNYRATTQNLTIAKATTKFPGGTTTTALVNALLYYKQVEFVQEGMRWLDILRLHIPVTHIDDQYGVTYSLTANDPRRVMQIPQSAQSNGGLPPNPR